MKKEAISFRLVFETVLVPSCHLDVFLYVCLVEFVDNVRVINVSAEYEAFQISI